MASCFKCGKHPIRKDRQGRFSCRRCGPRPERIVSGNEAPETQQGQPQ